MIKKNDYKINAKKSEFPIVRKSETNSKESARLITLLNREGEFKLKAKNEI